MRKLIIVMLALFMVGCATAPKPVSELDFVDSMCSSSSMVGSTTGFSALLFAKREELKSAEVKLSAEKYSKLSQELSGYNVQWESLNRDVLLACKQSALCSYRTCNMDNCANQQARYDDARKQASDFFLKVNALDISKASSQ